MNRYASTHKVSFPFISSRASRLQISPPLCVTFSLITQIVIVSNGLVIQLVFYALLFAASS